jgi:hypothetical protein
LQPGPQEDLNQRNWVLGSSGQRSWNSPAKLQPAREDQGACAGLAGGDVMVGVDRRGWNGGEPRRRQWSSTTAMVFRHGGAPAVDRRLGSSSREARRFD